jgi:hypothetical protein
MWECEWQVLKKTGPVIIQFLDQSARTQLSYTKYPRPSEEQIFASIKDGICFGLVECDITGPDHLKEKFSEMTPIFKNVEVVREDIGDYLKAYAVKNKLLKSPVGPW